MPPPSTRVTARLANAPERRILGSYQQTPVYHKPQYRLTPGFIAYYRAEITYEWANFVVSYPTDYMFANGNRNEGLPADYYDILDPVELVDEAAIGTTHYRSFLSHHFLRHFFRVWEERWEQRDMEQMSAEEPSAFEETYSHYNQARQALHGNVLFFFLAGEIVEDLQEGRFDQGEQRLAEFLQDNPYPAYTEVVEEVVRETARLKPGGVAAFLRSHRVGLRGGFF